MARGLRAWVVAWVALSGGGCGVTVRRRIPVVVYGDARVRTGTRPDGSPVYETRRRAVGHRSQVVRTRVSGVATYIGASLGYRPVPDVATLDTMLTVGMHFDRSSVDHVLALRFGLGQSVGPSDCSALSGGARVTYAARFRYRPWYVGPEVGLGGVVAARARCRSSFLAGGSDSRSTMEIVSAGVVAGYAVGRWTLGASLRVGLGTGRASSSGPTHYTFTDDIFDPTIAFAIETGYGF